jgi:hypothetical protein
MDFKIPRKLIKKFKEKAVNTTRLPQSLYHYTVETLKIFKKKKDKNYLLLLPLRKVISRLIVKGKITSHGKNCLVSVNLEFLKTYFKFHSEKLAIVDHKDYRRLAKLFYRIKKLTK